MQSISLVLLLIVRVDLGLSNEVVSQIDGLCGKCENIDASKYDSDELRTGPRYRILNGTIVRPSDLRWVASVYLRFCRNETERPCKSPKDYHYFIQCTGVLISSRLVLTAGHVSKLKFARKIVSLWSIKTNLFNLLAFKCLRNWGTKWKKDYWDGRYVSHFVAIGHDIRTSILSPDHSRKVKNFTNQQILNYAYDIGVLELEKPFILGNQTSIFPACLLNGTGLLKPGHRLLQGFLSLSLSMACFRFD